MIVIDSESRISLVDEDNPRFSVSTIHLEEPMVFRATNMEQAMSWVLFLRSCSFSHPTMSMDSFNIISTIGKGFYGKVILAQKKDTGELYAIKTVHKKRLVQSGKVHTIMTERNILRSSSHPFVITLHFAFQTLSKFYLVLEYVNGGDLFHHMAQDDFFSLDDIRLYTAEIASALHYIHSLGVVYRDLKPENVLLDSLGHIKLTDFGLSKELGNQELTTTFCGTNDYLAPEVIKREGYGIMVDWWALGILLYEMVFQATPFFHENASRMYNRILTEDPVFPFEPDSDVSSLIKGLLEKKPAKRFGYDQIVLHPFFNCIDFSKLLKKEYKPHYVPKVKDKLSVENFDHEFTIEQPFDSIGSPVIGSAERVSGFSFDNRLLMNDSLSSMGSILASNPLQ